jgi:tetratricopeptide (TPR) repeat protein
VVRDKVTVERVGDDDVTGGSSVKRRRRGATIDVSGVEFPGVASDTKSKLQRRLIEAAGAFEAERYGEAHKLLSSIESLAPGVPEVLELRGLTSYRLGKWKQAINDLLAFEAATDSVEQHHVLADCSRALGRWREVERYWNELGAASPSAELVEEGRIVYAGALADQGKLGDGIRLLEKAPRAPKKPKIHHLRRWYALADLYERAGELPKARRLFSEVNTLEPAFGDAGQRARNLR